MNRKNVFIRLLLMPIALLYSLSAWVRNQLFDLKLLPSKKYPVPVICVGNIAVGGTGKTPFTEYLIRLLRKKYRIATLSRGYKRLTKGFVWVSSDSTAAEVGDEACQIKQNFPDMLVVVDGNRRRGIDRLLALPEEKRPQLILLDDAMQHRYVTPSLTIMLTDYHHMYYDDVMLPAGNLRESKHGVYRADIVVVTKCKDVIKPIDLRIIEKNMMLMASQHLYFTNIKYYPLKALFPSMVMPSCPLHAIEADETVILIAGIADPQPFIKTVKLYNTHIQTCIFPDHHTFSLEDMQHINEKFLNTSSKKTRIITTEKDAMRLKTLDFLPEEWKPYIYYLPVSVAFLFDQGESFDLRILTHVMSTINIIRKNARN